MASVSVLMPLYQPNESYLAEQLKTIDAQEYEDAEVIIYNDCPDGTSWKAFCHRYLTRHSLSYIPNNTNLGYVKAFELLVNKAQGDYIAFADQDDRWLPGRLSRGAALLDEGYVLASCDRQIIDAEGNLVVPSWREAHPKDLSLTWKSDEHITPRAAFTCYSLGMATMIRADIAKQLVPFPTCTGHDKWLALGASALGACANIAEPLVQYRRHTTNQTGILQGINSKQDWYDHRTKDSYELACEFVERFPEHPDAQQILAFAEARVKKDRQTIWRMRELALDVAHFEIVLSLMPDSVFKQLLKLWRQGK